jgi:hypothetical protein
MNIFRKLAFGALHMTEPTIETDLNAGWNRYWECPDS